MKKSISLFLFLVLIKVVQAQNNVPPSYPGGDMVLMKQIYSQLDYPSYELHNNIEGVVYVQFYVEADGTKTHFKIAKGVEGGAGLDSAAMKACKGLGNFIPGTIDGVPSKSQLTIPVVFNLTDGDEEIVDKKLVKSHADLTCQNSAAIERAKQSNDKKQIKQAEKSNSQHQKEIQKYYRNRPEAFKLYKEEVEKCMKGRG